jgi:hypothetical protein
MNPSAVGAALLSSQQMCGIVGYARLFQQRQELLFECHFLVVLAPANVCGVFGVMDRVNIIIGIGMDSYA